MGWEREKQQLQTYIFDERERERQCERERDRERERQRERGRERGREENVCFYV